MKKELTIKRIWNALDRGETVHWCHEGYKVYVEPVRQDCEFQLNHFSRRGNKMLTIRCIENYFGGVIHKQELAKCFIAKKKTGMAK